MKEETNSNEKSKSSIGEHKGKPTIVSGFLNFTQPSSDDEWGDDIIDRIDVQVDKDENNNTIED